MMGDLEEHPVTEGPRISDSEGKWAGTDKWGVVVDPDVYAKDRLLENTRLFGMIKGCVLEDVWALEGELVCQKFVRGDGMIFYIRTDLNHLANGGYYIVLEKISKEEYDNLKSESGKAA